MEYFNFLGFKEYERSGEECKIPLDKPGRCWHSIGPFKDKGGGKSKLQTLITIETSRRVIYSLQGMGTWKVLHYDLYGKCFSLSLRSVSFKPRIRIRSYLIHADYMYMKHLALAAIDIETRGNTKIFLHYPGHVSVNKYLYYIDYCIWGLP